MTKLETPSNGPLSTSSEQCDYQQRSRHHYLRHSRNTLSDWRLLRHLNTKVRSLSGSGSSFASKYISPSLDDFPDLWI